ncbi:zinc finger CCCH domain-containing protein 14-like [Henckelia pumila]|uniref:zinc finger CCCH domain-containing protein 14-like n=1 Tax=Henckelia pumila TaxID=405737 RepID=UPI003C6DC8F0
MEKESYGYEDFAVSGEKSSSASSAVAAPMHFSRCNINPFVLPLSPTSQINSNASILLSYSALFQNCSPNSTSDTASFDGDGERQCFSSGSILEYQQLYNRYRHCLAQLHDSMAEADALRVENEALRLSNADLSNRVAVFFSLCDFNRLSIASPSSAANSHITRVERNNITVRSSGYLKINRPTTEPAATQSNNIQESEIRVYVPIVSKKEEEALEVYNVQGMFKTELCDKWQETGACPYGDNCQFAHGINELRPVMRHPRYKTEVCRMALTGDVCPYRHRCHFRHSLTD